MITIKKDGVYLLESGEEKILTFDEFIEIQKNEKDKLIDAKNIVELEIKKIKTDSIQDGATAGTNYDKSLKTEAGKMKTKLRNKAKELQSQFNKKYYGSTKSEEGNKFTQDLLIETYID